jgi:hypothetical protein
MRHITLPLTAIAVAGLVAACAQGPSSTSKAVQTEQLQCSDPTAWQASRSILQTTTVLKAEPIVFPLQSGKSGGGGRVSGAKLTVRPPEGVTAEELARALQCHAALARLGQIDRSQVPYDPTWLPHAWVDIAVEPSGGNFTVTLTTDSTHDNLRLYRRAVAFAEAQRRLAGTCSP